MLETILDAVGTLSAHDTKVALTTVGSLGALWGAAKAIGGVKRLLGTMGVLAPATIGAWGGLITSVIAAGYAWVDYSGPYVGALRAGATVIAGLSLFPFWYNAAILQHKYDDKHGPEARAALKNNPPKQS